MKYIAIAFIALFSMSQTFSLIEEFEQESEENILLPQIGLLLEGVALAWRGLVKLFGVSVKRELTYVITEKGFDFFDSSFQIQVLTNFDHHGLGKLEELLIKKWSGDSSKSQDVIQSLFLAIQFAERNSWSEHSVVFKNGATGNMGYACIFSMALENGKYNFVIVESQAKFKLSRELFLLKTTKKVGVLYSGSSIKLIYKDRAIDEQDIESLMYFLQLVAYKTVAKHFGASVDFQYPSLA